MFSSFLIHATILVLTLIDLYIIFSMYIFFVLFINYSNKFPEIRECLNISPYPLLIFLSSSVLRYSVSMIIKIGSEKTPI